MAGTFTDQNTLATDNAFIAKVRCAMIYRANQNATSSSRNTLDELQQAKSILMNAAAEASNMARLIASGNATIAAAAPAVPSDGDTQYAVNTTLALLI